MAGGKAATFVSAVWKLRKTLTGVQASDATVLRGVCVGGPPGQTHSSASPQGQERGKMYVSACELGKCLFQRLRVMVRGSEFHPGTTLPTQVAQCSWCFATDDAQSERRGESFPFHSDTEITQMGGLVGISMNTVASVARSSKKFRVRYKPRKSPFGSH